jgi:hypothetical protein
MSEVFNRVKSTPTTTPRDTLVEVSHTATEGILLYRPEDNSFIALYSDEWLVCRADGHKNKTAIEELQEANRAVTEKSLVLHDLLKQPNPSQADIARAEKDLDTALNALGEKSEAAKKRVEAISNQKTDSKKLVELLPLTMKRMQGESHTPIYVPAERLKNALEDRRVYFVEGAVERKKHPKEKLFNGSSLNTDEVRRRIGKKVQDSAKFEKKWKLAPKDADNFSGILTEWAKVMGTSATAFLERGQEEITSGIFSAEQHDPNNPYRIIDLKPEAQFMRWSAGASAETTFMPFQGNLFDKNDKNWGQRFKRAIKSAQFGVKANAEASFAIGEAKVETAVYMPHAAGWHMTTRELSQPLDFGYFRFRGEITLYAMAGASIAIEADAALMITQDTQALKGMWRKPKSASAKVGAKAETNVFAGLKEGIDLKGALQWLSPEGYVDPKGPKKVDPNKAIAAYTDLATVSADVSLIQGLAATLGFECRYVKGNFVIAAKAGACLGLGGSGSVGAEVNAKQIGQLFMFLAHQLKQSDYKKILALMNEATFIVFNKILYLHVAVGESIENFIGSSIRDIGEYYKKTIISIKSDGEQAIRKIEQNLKSGWGWYSYMPPEARGALISSIVDGFNNLNSSNNIDLRKIAAFSINELMVTTQSIGHLDNTLDRITPGIGQEAPRNQGVALIDSVVAGTIFSNCVNQCSLQVAQATPLMGRPFLRNDEPDFRLAQFPLHHPGYIFT